MVALDTPLNTRQLEVLGWVGEECPAREWPDSTYKTVAIALQNRRLIAISKKGGLWSASILDAGRHYLDHGTYPHGHLKPKKRSGAPNQAPNASRDRQAIRPAARNQSPTPTPVQTPGSGEPHAPTSPKLTPTRQLLRDVAEAGGTLTRNVKGDNTPYAVRVSTINRRGMPPDGQRLVMETGATYYEKIFRLEDRPVWRTMPPREVVDAPRIGRWHPAVTEIRDDGRSTRFGTEVRARALRILHAIATEAAARGHQVSAPAKNAPRGNGYYAHKETGQLIINIRSHRFFVSLHQLDDYTPHTPTPKELEKQRKWEWSRPPRWDITPGRRLRLRVYGDLLRGWDKKWADSKTLRVRVEDHLADAIQIIEDAVDREEARKAAELRAFEEENRRREAAEQLIEGRHAENMRAEALDLQLADWQHVTARRQYLAAMAARIDTITDEPARESATEWLHWCERHVDSRDLLHRPLAMPARRPPTWEEHSSLLREIMTELAADPDYREH
ncbi:hypothetical protein [Rhodococcus marinonascens]|uniref:hypothetical protein n=1 Tax=Rhodococcus marinonascens TaxID=38311 RepID=UPI0009329BD2|nr:hypothetical protein [Rhodococcus marinonascens]